jgi:AsmA protein
MIMVRTLLKVMAGVFVVVLVAVAGFFYTFDANSYREEIIELVEAITGRRIDISGDIDLSLYPWIGIKVSEVTVKNPVGFSKPVFADIGQLDLRMKVLPLLKRRLEIDKLVLHRLNVDLEKNAAGQSNWSGLAAANSGQLDSKLGLAGLTLGDVDIDDASISWLDQKTGQKLKVSRIRLDTEPADLGQPLPVTFKALIENKQSGWMAAVNAKAKLEFSADSAVLDAKALKLTAKVLLPDSDVFKFAMVADSVLDLQTQSARLTNARLGLFGLVVGATLDVQNLFSAPVIEGPIKVKTFEAGILAKHLKLKIPQLANDQSLKKIKLSGLFKTDFDSFRLDDISATVDHSKLEGSVRLAGMASPTIHYELKADRIDLDDYRTAGDITRQSDAPMRLDSITEVSLNGVFEVQTASVDGVQFSQVRVPADISDGVVTLDPVTMGVHQGDVKAAIRLDARETPLVTMNAEIRQVDAASAINPPLKHIAGEQAPSLTGQVDVDLAINATGRSIDALKRSAKGSLNLQMVNGTVEGIDFNYASQSVVVDYAKRNDFRVSRTFNDEYVPDSATKFDRLKATLKIEPGRLVNDDLLMISELVTVTGSGQLDWVNRKLDYQPVIDMHVKNTGNVRDKLRDNPMRYHLEGPLGQLTCRFDVDRYDLHMGRLMIQEAKAHRNRMINSQSGHSWQNVLSK